MSVPFQKVIACLVATLLVLPVAFSFPTSAYATTCGTGFTDNGDGTCIAFLISTATSTITLLSSLTTYKIEAIGGGGGGAEGFSGYGGGGGEYRILSSYATSGSPVVTYIVGAGGAGAVGGSGNDGATSTPTEFGSNQGC